ncbi:hypothetical protein [Paraburkholderia tropica]|uniref:hypothetical protein n=1 Tax=Paraburkholderia tropica TaxID=92647 RepID=UPI001CC6E05C|nr:hypothetical protein [Paraburkholderia tropica]
MMIEVIARKATRKAFYFPTTADFQKAVKKAKKAGVAPVEVVAEVVTPPAPAPESARAAKGANKRASKHTTKRAKKDKAARHRIAIAKADQKRISRLKRKCGHAGVTVKKRDLLRAGLLMLDGASKKRLAAAISALDSTKSERAGKGR